MLCALCVYFVFFEFECEFEFRLSSSYLGHRLGLAVCVQMDLWVFSGVFKPSSNLIMQLLTLVVFSRLG